MAAMVYNGMLKRSSTNALIFSLCTSDLLLGSSMVAWKFEHLASIYKWAETETLAVVSYVAVASMAAGYFSSGTHIILIGLDRLLATAMPLRYKVYMNADTCQKFLPIVWVLHLLGTYVPIGYKAWGLAQKDVYVVINYSQDSFPDVYNLYFLVPFATLSLCTCATVYSAVIIVYLRAQHRIQNSRGHQTQKVTKMILKVVAVNIAFNGPIIACSSLPTPDASVWPHFTFYHVAFELAFFFMVIPTFCNNFIYASHLPEFKEAHKKLFHWQSRPSSVVPSQDTSSVKLQLSKNHK